MKLLLSAVALVAMAAGSALAQQKGTASASNDQVNLVMLAGIEVVQKDLGVGDDVARKLTSLRDEFRVANGMEQEKAGIPAPGPQQRPTAEQQQKTREIVVKLNNEFVPKVTGLLSADQVKRLQQIQLQSRLVLGPMALFAPDLASELKLTDDQRQSLRALSAEMRERQFPGGAGGVAVGREAIDRAHKVAEEYATKAVDVLTAQQKETLNKLKGGEFDAAKVFPGVASLIIAGPARVQQKTEGAVESGRVQSDDILFLATNETVQKDLGVSDDVSRKLMSLLRVDYRKAEQKALEDAGVTNIQDRMRMMTRERQKYNEITKKAQDEFIPKLKELFTAEQYKRLQQIQLQNRFNMDGPKTLLEPEVASVLKLTADQKELLSDLSKDFSRSGPFQIFNGKRSFPYGTSGIKHGKEYRAQVIEMLTAEQKQALNKLEGNEFDLSAFVIMSRPFPPR